MMIVVLIEGAGVGERTECRELASFAHKPKEGELIITRRWLLAVAPRGGFVNTHDGESTFNLIHGFI